MANTLPNKITKAQAEAAANETYDRYAQLSGVYDAIRTQAEGGAFSYTVTISDGDAEEVTFITDELIADGYTISVESNQITITWGEEPPH